MVCGASALSRMSRCPEGSTVPKPVVLIAEELSPATIEALGPDFDVRSVDGTDREALFATHQWLIDTLKGFGQYIVLTHDFSLLRLFIKSQNNAWGKSMKKVGRIGLHVFYRTYGGGWS